MFRLKSSRRIAGFLIIIAIQYLMHKKAKHLNESAKKGSNFFPNTLTKTIEVIAIAVVVTVTVAVAVWNLKNSGLRYK